MAESGTPRRRIPLPRPMLRARINDVRVLASLIRPIAMAAHATVLVEEGGLIFLTEYDRCVQARAYVVKQLFASYETNLDRALNPDADFTLDTLEGPGPVEFEINLKTFLESIDIFGGAPTIKANGPGSSSSGPGGFGNFGQGRTMYRPYDPAATKVEGQGKWKRRFGTGFGTAEGDRDDEDSDRHVSRPTSMVMSYEGKGSPLILVLDEPDVTTRCSLATFERSDRFEYTFAREACVAQVIMKSDGLQEAFEVIDSSCTKVAIHFLPADRGGPTIAGPRPRRARTKESLRLTADADFGAVEMDFPKEGGIIDTFLCEETTVNCYRFAHLQQAIKALQVSIKVSIRVDERGLLCMQFLMPKGTGTAPDPAMKAIGTPVGASIQGGHGYIQLMLCPLDEEIDEEEEGDGEVNDGYGMYS